MNSRGSRGAFDGDHGLGRTLANFSLFTHFRWIVAFRQIVGRRIFAAARQARLGYGWRPDEERDEEIERIRHVQRAIMDCESAARMRCTARSRGAPRKRQRCPGP